MALQHQLLRLFPRQDQGGSRTGDQFLDLLNDPFRSQASSSRNPKAYNTSAGLQLTTFDAEKIQDGAVVAAIASSLPITLGLALLFSILRPHNTVVYAPRAKHADEKHAPPHIKKGLLEWFRPVRSEGEAELVEKIGLDAALFLRFTRMCRSMFIVLTIVGCAVYIPVNVLVPLRLISGASWSVGALARITPQFLFGAPFWTYVIMAYIFDGIICYFLWTNYRAIVRLRKSFFESPEYKGSLHSRTLMVTDIKRDLRTDDGLMRIVDECRATSDVPSTAVARNVKELPILIEEHEKAVRNLESVLATYLENPDRLPEKRPTCKPLKTDRSYTGSRHQDVDAIDYLMDRIRRLEKEIKDVRRSVGMKNPMSYGFASYSKIEEAHKVAYAARNKRPQGSIVQLAARPLDLIWQNLSISLGDRRWKNIWNNIWVTTLTIFWVIPNALIAVFLVDLGNIARLSPGFARERQQRPVLWSIVQGVAAPAITSLFYYYLPSVFRRLSVSGGDLTKTSRERHVTHKLYSFFVFNNLIVFSLFSTVFTFILTVVYAAENDSQSTWDGIVAARPFQGMMLSLCGISPYWVSWQIQRQIGAVVDLSQLVTLTWGYVRRHFLSPTPRELIEATAPQPFDYASYYNSFLFYATVGVCFAPVQPLILPVTLFYFALDAWLKKYLLLYVFITKNESGGAFWRMLFNRFLFLTLLGNCVTALLVGARGDTWAMLGCLAPIPFLIIGFKWYCSRTFDDQMHYYLPGTTTDIEGVVTPTEHEAKTTKQDKVSVRFGHPALYKPLISPMVHAKAQHLLAQVYRNQHASDDLDDSASIAGYSDIYMDPMDRQHVGKSSKPAPFEVVAEGDLDLENFKDRPEFKDKFGGDGELFGKPTDLTSRPGTPGSMMKGYRSGSMSGSQSRSRSRGRAELEGTSYPSGYHHTPSAALRGQSPSRNSSPARSMASCDEEGDIGRKGLVSAASPMGRGGYVGRFSRASTPDDDTSYEYFRRGRA